MTSPAPTGKRSLMANDNCKRSLYFHFTVVCVFYLLFIYLSIFPSYYYFFKSFVYLFTSLLIFIISTALFIILHAFLFLTRINSFYLYCLLHLPFEFRVFHNFSSFIDQDSIRLSWWQDPQFSLFGNLSRCK